MRQIIERLYVGSMADYEAMGDSVLEYSVLGACKEPLHRINAKLRGASAPGYLGKAMPKDEPEYLWAERRHALYLNLIDAPDKKYIPRVAIDKAMEFIEREIADNRRILIVGNKGESRSPSIALMFMMHIGMFEEKMSYDEVVGIFTRRFCPEYAPGKGMADFTRDYWEDYRGKQGQKQ